MDKSVAIWVVPTRVGVNHSVDRVACPGCPSSPHAWGLTDEARQELRGWNRRPHTRGGEPITPLPCANVVSRNFGNLIDPAGVLFSEQGGSDDASCPDDYFDG